MSPLVSELPSFVADVQFGDVALLGDFDALFVREFGEAPKQVAAAAGPAVMEGIASSLLLTVANGEEGLSAERLDGLINQLFGLTRVLLVGWNRRRRRFGLGRDLRCCCRRNGLWQLPCKGADHAHQNQNREKQFHST